MLVSAGCGPRTSRCLIGTRADTGFCTLLLIVLLSGRAVQGQTACATAHPGPGVFICYPDPAANAADANLDHVFHLSAQGNAPEGGTVTRYAVVIDDRRIYENRLAIPTPRLSVEINLLSPFRSGSHTVHVVMDGAGAAEVAGLQFHPLANLGFCQPFNRFDARTCLTSNARGPLEWPVAGAAPLSGLAAYAELYRRNLESVEADVADAVAVDAQGNLYAASHQSADVELRKYAPNGSITYDALFRACGNGFTSVAGIAIDRAGRAWIAGNTTACLSTTPGALEAAAGEGAVLRGFVILADTAKPASDPPVYSTYLARAENRINAIRVDANGNAFVAGATASAQFPHSTSMSVGGSVEHARGNGFVSVLNPSGSALRWSALLPGGPLTALDLDTSGDVWVTGRAPARRSSDPDDLLLAVISDQGRQMPYRARIYGGAQNRAIAVAPSGTWAAVVGTSDEPGAVSFAFEFQRCGRGVGNSLMFPVPVLAAVPEIALPPALDAFVRAFPEELPRTTTQGEPKMPFFEVQIAPPCHP